MKIYKLFVVELWLNKICANASMEDIQKMTPNDESEAPTRHEFTPLDRLQAVRGNYNLIS